MIPPRPSLIRDSDAALNLYKIIFMTKKSSIQFQFKLHEFLENPKTTMGYIFQWLIISLIILSVIVFGIQTYLPGLTQLIQQPLMIIEYVALGVFTMEYLARLAVAPEKIKFIRKPLNVVDFLAVFPAYLEILFVLVPSLMPLRALRLLRVLRFARLIRVLKLMRYQKLLKQVLRYNDTILQSIMPIILSFIVVKAGLWALEYYGIWAPNAQLGELFATIGFALGIILSQKIGSTYDKFIQIEETAIRISGTLHSLSLILNAVKPRLGTNVCKRWAHVFLEAVQSKQSMDPRMKLVNVELYHAILQVEAIPAELAILHGDLSRDSAFCLSKKTRLTPKAYDTLLHQAIVVYLLMIAVFIPGATGMVSVGLATYILYGMYNVTQDLDSILGGEFNLINIDISELQEFAKQDNNLLN